MWIRPTEIYKIARNGFICCGVANLCLNRLSCIDNNIIHASGVPVLMNSRIYKSVHFDASHRLMHYRGKCANLHGHRWRVEVWLEGRVDDVTGILIDYNTIKSIIERFDHQTILNRDDPMVPCIRQFQQVITTEGDPTSELLAGLFTEMLDEECRNSGIIAHVVRIRVWESDTCFAELRHESH